MKNILGAPVNMHAVANPCAFICFILFSCEPFWGLSFGLFAGLLHDFLFLVVLVPAHFPNRMVRYVTYVTLSC
jgi:hypothetical protein